MLKYYTCWLLTLAFAVLIAPILQVRSEACLFIGGMDGRRLLPPGTKLGPMIGRRLLELFVAKEEAQ